MRSRSIAAGLALLALAGGLVVGPPAPAEASLAGPAADAIQTCLVRSGIVPVAVDAAGAAEAAQ